MQSCLVDSQQIAAIFDKAFQDVFNTCCYECGRNCKQWIQLELAIFLCLNCATLYKENCSFADIKAVNDDRWSAHQLKVIKVGGNRKLRLFLCNYQLQQYTYRQRLKTKAVQYYRIMIKEQSQNRSAPLAPDIITGKQLIKQDKELTDMNSDQILQEAKQKATYVGSKAKEISSKIYESASHKISSGELKEDIKKTAGDISEKAKDTWDTICLKMDSIFN